MQKVILLLQTSALHVILLVHMIYGQWIRGGYFVMAQAEIGGAPQQGVLLRRAHELLESIGQPVAEDMLLQHLFGVTEGTGKNAIWQTLLRKSLENSSLFEQTEEHQWGLLAC